MHQTTTGTRVADPSSGEIRDLTERADGAPQRVDAISVGLGLLLALMLAVPLIARLAGDWF